MTEHDPALDLTNISSVPDEIIEHNIFNNFVFNKWIKTFTLVCKRWKRICDRSTIDPKQLTLHIGDQFNDIGIIIKVINKYQPTILYIDTTCLYEDKFIIYRMCQASTRLNTLVMEGFNLEHEIYIKPVPRITTLAITEETLMYLVTRNLKQIFPNLKRLQVYCCKYSNPGFYGKELTFLEELVLEITEPSELALKHLGIPKIITINHTNKTVLITAKSSYTITPMNLDYKTYFQYFGQTQFHSMLLKQEFTEASDFLAHRSLDYDNYLYENRLEYEFPTSIKPGQFRGISTYWQAFNTNKTAFDTFSKTMVVPINERIEALVRFDQLNEALIVFGVLNETELDLSKETFFTKLLPAASKSDLRQEYVIDNVKKIIHTDVTQLQSAEDFAKIVDLRDDWSNQKAITTNAELCYQMYYFGCKIDAAEFCLKSSPSLTKILDLLCAREDSTLVDLTVNQPKLLKDNLNIENVPLHIEKDGKSLFNTLIQNGILDRPGNLAKYQHLANHMDSNGQTPLIMALKRKSSPDYDMVEKLLELGADPMKHRGDKVSALVTALKYCHRCQTLSQLTDLINILVEYGADLNAPCWFEERMCSPLMVAILHLLDKEIIRYLIALGARVDYADETGRTVLDCATEMSFMYDDFHKELSHFLHQ